MENLVHRYLETWNQTNAQTRRASIHALFAEQCSYTDPNVIVAGWDSIDGFIGAVQKQFAGVVFVLGGTVDAHHDVARFTWHAMAPGLLEPVAIGFDVLVTEGGCIKQVVGFLDKVPG
jgi:hypothetical protein